MDAVSMLQSAVFYACLKSGNVVIITESMLLSSTLSLLSNSSANHYLVKISHLNHFLLQFGHSPVGKDAVVCVGHFDQCVCTTWFCITAIIIQVFSAEHLHTMVQWTPSGMTAPWSAYLYLLVLHHCCYYPGLLCSTPAHNGSMNTKWCDSILIRVFVHLVLYQPTIVKLVLIQMHKVFFNEAFT